MYCKPVMTNREDAFFCWENAQRIDNEQLNLMGQCWAHYQAEQSGACFWLASEPTY